MKRPHWYAAVTGSLIIVAVLGYRVAWRRDGGMTNVGNDLVAALQTSSVEVPNGQAAVIKGSQGYVILVPVKRTLEDLRITAYLSKSGSFNDAVRLIDEDARVNRRINVGGSEILLEGGSDSSTYVTLSIGDANTRIALSKTAVPQQVRVSTLVFNGNPQFDSDKAFERFKERNSVK